METKITAVEWLALKFSESSEDELAENINIWFGQAIAMEKEQIITFAKLWEKKLLDGRIDSVDDLYNETYGDAE